MTRADQYAMPTFPTPPDDYDVQDQRELRRAVSGALATMGNRTVSSGPYIDVTASPYLAPNDSSADATALIQNASDNAAGRTVFFPKGTYTVSNRISVTQNKVSWLFEPGATLLYTGGRTDRLLNVTGQDFTCHGAILSGNSAQVFGALVYVHDNAKHTRFINTTFRDIVGTHADGAQLDMTNSQYGLIFSPYGAQDFVVQDCIFDTISNDNTGLNIAGGLPYIGGGFAGGIFFMTLANLGNLSTETFGDLTVPQTAPTGGVVTGCTFQDIRTPLLAGLSLSDQIEYNDADGIRFYGGPTGANELHVHITDCMFRRCSKRAVKGSTGAHFTVENCIVDSRGMQYAMITAVKLEEGCHIDGLTVLCDAAKPIQVAFQSHDGSHIFVSRVYVNTCATLYDFDPSTPTQVITGHHFRNIRCDAITVAGFTVSTTCLSLSDMYYEDIVLIADPSTHGIQGFLNPQCSSNLTGCTVNRMYLKGCEFRLEGFNNIGRHIVVEVDDAAFVGTLNAGTGLRDRSLVSFGTSPNLAVQYNILEDLTVRCVTLPAGYLSATRPILVSLHGDNMRLRGITLSVPSNITGINWAHVAVYGSQITLDGLTYDGHGFCTISSDFSGAYGPYKNVTVRNSSRIGSVTTASAAFLYLSAGSNNTVSDTSDYRNNVNGTIVITGGTVAAGMVNAYLVDGVQSVSTAVNIVGVSGTVAIVLNVRGFAIGIGAAIPNPAPPGAVYAQAEAQSTSNTVISILSVMRTNGWIP